MTSNDILSCTPHEDVITKATFRFKVWNLLENKDLVRFPRPCKGRIPNFVDCTNAAEKLTGLDEFKKANVIKVNIDKPQEGVRFAVLEEGKTLLVPIPRLEDGLVMKVCPPADANRGLLNFACKRRGVNQYGKPVDLDGNLKVDMIVLGSVAVSKDGHRIGKGEGFSDLEFAVMAATGAVTENTVIVTTVHDEQVFDTLPHELFQPFDVPVDFIITPTKVIEVVPRLPKPKGILWNVLSDRRLQLIPLLKKLRDKEMEQGNECSLKEVDSEPEERPRPYYRPSFPRRRPFQPRPQYRRRNSQETVRRTSQEPRPRTRTNQGPRSRTNEEPRNRSISENNNANRRTRTFRRNLKQVDGSGDAEVRTNGTNAQHERGTKRNQNEDGENKENQREQGPRPFRRTQQRYYKNRLPPADFSVKVSNIGATVRVRDLKAALIEKGVRPRDITWKGPKGFAYLHFAKMKAQQEQPTAVDDVIASLQGLKVKCKNESEIQETFLNVEPAKPISRIENAGVTAV